MNPSTTAQSAGKPTILTGRHVLAALLGFFGLIVVVNGIFIYFALDTFRGVETDQAYLKGLAYNQTLDQAADQRDLGWSVVLEAAPGTQDERHFVARYRDKNGQALTNLQVRLALAHPADAGLDQVTAMRSRGDGSYEAQLPLLQLGQWRATVAASDSDGQVHRQETRLWLK